MLRPTAQRKCMDSSKSLRVMNDEVYEYLKSPCTNFADGTTPCEQH